ncbi:MAG: DUF3179 domain-containing protein [Chloroflexi bacterium]|nr:DUF3179 domain-containing protein [Chloroflexota bacterium]
MRGRTALASILVFASSCTADTGAVPGADDRPASPMESPALATPTLNVSWPDPPDVPDGPLDPSVSEAVDRLIATILPRSLDRDALQVVAASDDARLAWFISDFLRFLQGGTEEEALVEAFTDLTGVNPSGDDRFGRVAWLAVTNLLIAWDLPAPPDYRERKAALYLAVEPGWEPFFADPDSVIDWRLVSWGGVFIDDRPAGDRSPCARGCIPALDDPALTPAADGDWYADHRIVFGVVVGDEAVAFPKHIMEVHEMVNITIGGRRIGMPYCTLCGSPQAYLTDAVPEGVETPVLRTSGLLSRSNKVMYDLVTGSVFDTFIGRAISGPLEDIGFVLEQTSVVVSTWGEWRAAHPDTMIVAQDGGIGRTYLDDPLGGRDDAGPIFPIGEADPRLPKQTRVLGVIDPDGQPVAFPVEQATAALTSGREVSLGVVEVVADGGGLRAKLRGGEEIPAHEAFWFAWSQFHPETLVWTPLDR